MSRSQIGVSLSLLIALAVIGPAGMDMYLPAISVMPTQLDASTSDIQLTLSIYMLALGVGQLVLGPVADRWGRRPVMLLSLLLFAVGSLGAALVASVEFLIGWRILQGFGGCGAGLVAFAMVRDCYQPGERTRVYSLLNAGIGIAPALAPIMGSYLLLWGEWRSTFWALLLLGVGVGLACYFHVQETCPASDNKSRSTIRGGYSQLCRHRSYLSYCAAGLACMSGLFVFFSLSPLLLVGQWQVSEQQFAYYFASNAVVMMLTSMVASRIGGRLGPRNSVLIGLGFICCSGFLLLSFILLDCLGPLSLMMSVWLSSCGFSLVMGASAAGALADFGEMAARATALMSSVRLGGAALVGSWAIWWDSSSAWSLVWVWLVLGGLSGLAVWRYCTEGQPE